MSNDEIIRSWKGEAQPSPEPETAPENPAGEIDLSQDELENVAGGSLPTMECTGGNTYCHGTCGIPFTTLGCCASGVT